MRTTARAGGTICILLAGVIALGCGTSTTKKEAEAKPKKPSGPPPAKIALQDAVDEGYATLNVHGINLIKVSVSVTCDYKTTITIPGGTVFGSGDPEAQNMMVAVTHTMSFPGPGGPGGTGQPAAGATQTVELEAYCTERWKHIPSKSTSFSLPKQPDSDLTKLGRCLEKHKDKYPHRLRQQAIWVLKNMDLSLDEFARKEAAEVADQVGTWEAQRKALKQEFPDLSDQRIEEVLNKMKQELAAKGMSLQDEIRKSQNQASLQSLREVRTVLRPLLENCNFNLTGKRFFQDN